ncbi:MAG: hypothetical protein NT151_07860 [Acidobacteria bacterium]|nr:hypothetical protein [Acidobacteriota bacterium]
MAQHVRSNNGAGTLWGFLTAARGTAAWLKRFLTLSLTLVALALIFGVYIYYDWEAQRIQTQKYNEIAAIARMKVDQILRWRHERLADVRRTAESPTLRATAAEWLRDPGQPVLRAELLGRLILERDTGEYDDAILVDAEARLLLSARAAPGPLNGAVRRTVAMALKSSGPVLGDLYRVGHGPIGIDTAEAMRDSSGRVLAVIILSSPAADFLYPMIQSWPTPSQSAARMGGPSGCSAPSRM